MSVYITYDYMLKGLPAYACKRHGSVSFTRKGAKISRVELTWIRWRCEMTKDRVDQFSKNQLWRLLDPPDMRNSRHIFRYKKSEILKYPNQHRGLSFVKLKPK